MVKDNICPLADMSGVVFRSNTAKLLEANPTRLSMHELEVFERVAGKTELTVLLGEEGKLAERDLKLM